MAYRKKEDAINKRFAESSLEKAKGVEKAKLDKEKYTIPPIQISKSSATLLKDHFKGKGLSLSAGVRFVLYDYIEKKL